MRMPILVEFWEAIKCPDFELDKYLEKGYEPYAVVGDTHTNAYSQEVTTTIYHFLRRKNIRNMTDGSLMFKTKDDGVVIKINGDKNGVIEDKNHERTCFTNGS